VIRRLALEGEIRLAVNRDELSLNYQPIVQVTDGRVTGVEALLRWNHPVLGQVPPADFIPVCEEIGYIVELGGWVIDEAVGRLAALRAQYPHSEQLSMAINVSARQLRDERLCDHVARAMVKYNLPANALCIEITESLLVENLTAIAETLTTLRGFGVRIAIDDFGTGYSSLAYLRRLPVDEIKIDRQFISNLGQDRSDDSLVAAILAMANSLGYTSVAEGVETELQMNRLVELGCEHAQGFAFATPVPGDELPAVVDRLGLAAAPRLRVVRDLA
jgi:EAL domain-containing protein (putative c-di-GMP-specific phosphodiesterase class I)